MDQMVAWANLRAWDRQAAETADALIALAADRKSSRDDLLNTARRRAEQSEQDWNDDARAFDKWKIAVM